MSNSGYVPTPEFSTVDTIETFDNDVETVFGLFDVAENAYIAFQQKDRRRAVVSQDSLSFSIAADAGAVPTDEYFLDIFAKRRRVEISVTSVIITRFF